MINQENKDNAAKEIPLPIDTDREQRASRLEISNKGYAGFWIRVLASIIDSLIMGIPFAIAYVTLSVIFRAIPGINYIIIVVYLAIITYMEGIKGGTPGKLVLGLKIVDVQGNLIGIKRAIVRTLGKMLSGSFFGIGYAVILFDRKKQGLHDKIARTYVIYMR
ncbi:TPA: RDD family protein [Candidatus Woesearchaeota archaeon]|nr:RDD family protein [Candidatus Woesearchaeota archaeon]